MPTAQDYANLGQWAKNRTALMAYAAATKPKPVAPKLVAPKPVTPPAVRGPSAGQYEQWYNQTANAKNQYMRTYAQNQYGMGQAGVAYNQGLTNLRYNQGVQRQAFDDPYIGRGIFNSGIRGQGLTQMGTGYTNQFNDLLNQYQGQMGQFRLSNLQARSTRDQYLAQVRAQEQAARQSLAAQINLVK